MTMPDVDTILRQPSRGYSVHYICPHNYPGSPRTASRAGACDPSDSMLCATHQHLSEIRTWERLRGLKEKALFDHGYAPVDSILERSSSAIAPPHRNPGLNVLVAPSWGPHGILEGGAEPLIA